MNCLKCGSENPKGAKFCCNCGITLEISKCCTNSECSEFGKYILPLDSIFCPTCGEKIKQTERSKDNPVSQKQSIQSNSITLSKVDRQIEIKVKEIIADKLGVDISELTYNANFATDLNADSLDVVELIMEFEQVFGISIPDEDTQKISTVADAISYVQKMSNK